MLNKLILALVIALGLWFFLGLIIKGIDKEEQIECYKLQEQSQEYRRGFFITKWQKEMCDRWNIKVDAPVESNII
jgi:hypothetical protein